MALLLAHMLRRSPNFDLLITFTVFRLVPAIKATKKARKILVLSPSFLAHPQHSCYFVWQSSFPSHHRSFVSAEARPLFSAISNRIYSIPCHSRWYDSPEFKVEMYAFFFNPHNVSISSPRLIPESWPLETLVFCPIF